MSHDGGPAFPVFFRDIKGMDGMSLRDYFAAHAPEVPPDFNRLSQTTVVNDGYDRKRVSNMVEPYTTWMVRWRWHYADLMLKARDA